MAKTAKQREKARDQERKGNWKEALALYEKIVEAEPDDDPDLTLLNKIGDLRLRAGRIDGAVQAWERAAASYAESGLPNNAIALCRKVQRVAPDRIEVYRQLGQLSAANGFLADARENFLTYAERKQRLGDLDASFAALAEFADLFPEDIAVRQTLAERLVTHDREEEAVHQYRVVLESAERLGDVATAEQARERLSELGAETTADPVGHPDPSAIPEDGEDGDDVGTAPLPGLEPTGMEVEEPDEMEPLPLLDMEPQGDGSGTGDDPGSAHGLDVGASAFDDDAELVDISPIEGLEATTLEPGEEVGEPASHAAEESDESGDGTLLDIDAAQYDAGDDAAGSGLSAGSGLEEIEAGDDGLPLLDLDHPEPVETQPPAGDTEAAVETPPADPVQEGLTAVSADPANLVALEALLAAPAGARAAEVETAARGVPGALAERGNHAAAVQAIGVLLSRWPEDIRLLQKRAEYAFRAGDRSGLLTAYADLAARLEKVGQGEKAAAVRQRIRDIDPEHPSLRPPPSSAPQAQPADQGQGDFVDLGAMILGESDRSSGTRFVVPEEEPTGDEDRDFAEMLSQFKAKVTENIAVEDSSSHFDLGLAFKDMGLIDEAIGQFQVALRGGAEPLATLEVLGQCFSEKGQVAVAARVLERALSVPGAGDGDLVGVLYQLACCEEALGREAAAREHYERVLAVDVSFRDASVRLARLSAG